MDIKKIEIEGKKLLSNISSADELETARVHIFGRKGILATAFAEMKEKSEEDRKQIGKKLNEIKSELENMFSTLSSRLQEKVPGFDFDETEPGKYFYVGKKHVLTQVREDIEEYFQKIGFDVMEGPEVENQYYNFEALNIPKDHPARDMWDTFWIKNDNKKRDPELLLRTHTSPMQVRIMEKAKPPLAVVVPGRVFRHEATDAKHEHTFDQIEGFFVDENVDAGQLKSVLHGLFKHLFGDDVEIQLRPSYFPFTEPSFELFMKSDKKFGGSHWLEMLGSGMIHQKVFEAAGYPKNKYTGFAFGIGFARIALLKYGIPDIRKFYENDLRFLRQF